MSIKLLHCADLHIDAILGDSVRAQEANELSKEERTLLRDSPILALNAVRDAAINNEVDLLVIAGDIFDKKENVAVLSRAQIKFSAFLNQLAKANIKVFIALGNHDPLSTINEMKKTWPENVHVFSNKKPEIIAIEVNGETVFLHGASFEKNDESRNLCADFPAKVNDAYNIGVLHTNVSSNTNHSNYAPSTLSDLTSFNYDYFALGHIHKREVISEYPLVAYSGNTQGLSAKPSEQEPKGCLIVEIASPGAKANFEFISTDTIRYTTVDLVCESVNSYEDIIEAFDEAINQTQNDFDLLYLSRVNITLPKSNFLIDEENIKRSINELRPNTFVTSVKINQSSSSWEELIEGDEFFSRINDSLFQSQTFENIEVGIYGAKETQVLSYLPKDTFDKPNEQDVIEVLVSTHSQLNAKGN